MLLAISWLTCKYLVMIRDSTGDARPRQRDETAHGHYDVPAAPGTVKLCAILSWYRRRQSWAANSAGAGLLPSAA